MSGRLRASRLTEPGGWVAGIAGFGFVVVVLTNALPAQPDARSIGDWWGRDPVIVGFASLVLAIGFALIALWWLRGPRDRAGSVVAEYEPPDGLSPAEFGALVDGCASPRHVTATLIDLAIRGHVRLEEVVDRGWVIEHVMGVALPHRRFEKTFLELLFSSGDQVELDDTGLDYYLLVGRTELELDAEMVERGWFLADPALIRRRRRLRGLLVIGLGLLATAVLGIRLGAGFVGLALVVVGIALTVAAGAMHPRSSAAHALLQRALGFRLYLRVAEAQPQRFAEHVDLFTRYLPYAIALGLAREWATRFDLAGTIYTRVWYKPASPGELRHVALAEHLSRVAEGRH